MPTVTFVEQDRVYVRHFLGASAIFIQAIPLIENALTAVQATTDNGTRPDDSTVKFILGLIYGSAAVVGPPAIPAKQGLLTIEQKLEGLWNQASVGKVNKIDLDAARGSAMLRREGRRLVRGLCSMLSMRGPLSDVFSSSASSGNGDFAAAYERTDFRG